MVTGASDGGRRTRERPWRTLRGRLILGALAGLLAASLVFAVTASSLVRSESERTARKEFDRQTVQLAALIESRFTRQIENGTCETYSPADLEAFVGPGTRMFVSGANLCADASGGDIDDAPKRMAERVIDSVIRENRFQHIDGVPLEGDTDTVATAAAIHYRNSPHIITRLILVKPREEVRTSIADVGPPLVAATIIGFVPALLLSLLVTTRLTRPIREMREATDRVAAGDLSSEVERSGTADLDALADDFNVMVARLRERETASRDFLMKVTHDLRTPLTAIRGHAAALADGVVPEAQEARSFAAIEGETGRLEAMVEDLLDLARIDAHRFTTSPTPLDPAEVLDQAVDVHSADAGLRGLRLERRIGPLPAVVTDARRLRQIVDNLIDNALRWTPEGGTVAVVAEPGSDGRGIRVAVSDTGPGVPAHARELIFEPFRSSETPEGRTGTGLGLAICRQLARALGGDVIVGEQPGGGAVFVLTLPAAAPAAPAAETADVAPVAT